MIASTWTCDNCGRREVIERTESGPSTPNGVYIPKAYLRMPELAAPTVPRGPYDTSDLTASHDFWFCEACTDLSDDLIGAVLMTRLRGRTTLRRL